MWCIIALLTMVSLSVMITYMARDYVAGKMERVLYVNEAWARAHVTTISHTHIRMPTYTGRLRVAYV